MEPLVSEEHVDHGADDDDDENDQHSETLVSEDYKKKNPTKYFLNMCFGRRQRFGFIILFFSRKTPLPLRFWISWRV